MSPRRDLLVVCSFFPSDSLVEETVRRFADVADLYLVPVGARGVVPEAAEPHLATRRLGLAADHFEPCKKWRTVVRLLERLDVERYDYLLFPDDDLEYVDDFPHRFLDLLDREDVALAQPALTPDSFHTYDLCVRREGVSLRLTNFVEVMAPCFRRDAFRLLRPTIDAELSPMGYGFDLHWPYACEAAGLRMAIVDETPIAHRFRPTGKHYGGDDLHGQGHAYGRKFPRIQIHEMREIETIPHVKAP